MKQKMGALLLAMLMLVSILAGCGTEDVPETTGGSSQETEQNTPSTGEAQVREFEYFAPLSDPYPETSPIYDALEEATGINVTYTWTTTDAFNTVLTSRIAEGDLPDVIGGATGSLMDELVEEGLIVSLTDLLAEKMPNYYRFVTEAELPYLVSTVDGEIYKFGYIVDFPGQVSWMIRQDWLDDLSLPIPETWDEWVATWRAFKANDMNGNGQSDEIPLLIRYSYFYYYLNMFGIESNNTYSVVDGEAVYDSEHPLYEEFLDAMRMLYAEGLIPADYLTIGKNELSELQGANRVGSICNDAVNAGTIGSLLAEIDEDALYVCTSPVESPYGIKTIRQRKAVQANTWITTAAVEEGKLDAILEYYNYIFSDEGIFLTNYGIEGETYEKVDGEAKLLEPYVLDYANARAYGIIPSTIPFYFTKDVYLSIMFAGAEIDTLDKYSQQSVIGLTSANEAYFYSIPPTITTEETLEYADLIDAQKALRDQYIMGQITKEEYQKEYQALKDAGLTEVFESIREAYANMMQKFN